MRKMLVAFLLALLSGCTNPKGPEILNIPDLVNKSEYEVEKLLGKPDTAYSYSFLNKRYRVNRYKKNGVEIRYLNATTAEIIIRNPINIPFKPSSLVLFGLPETKPTLFDDAATIQWKNISGIKAVNFYKVGKEPESDDKPVFEVYFNLR